MSRPLVIAHRGGAGEAPENTRSGFRQALSAGVDGLEADVHLTRDGVLVVHHDPCLALTPDADPVSIGSVDAERVVGADLSWTHGPAFAGETPLTLDELLDLAGETLVMIEMKRGPDDRALGEALAARLGSDPWLDQRVAASFSTDALVGVRMGCPQVRRLGLVREDFDLEAQSYLPLWGQGFLRDLIPGAALDQARARERRAWVWTVDAVDQVPSLVSAGVDALITDLPTSVSAALAS